MAIPVSPVVDGFQHLEVRVAENQPQYNVLPSLPIDDDMGTLLTRWELTEEEIAYIVKHRCLYIWLATFGEPIQPLRVTAEDLKIGQRGEPSTLDATRNHIKSNGGVG